MKAGRGFDFFSVRLMVRKYQRQMVLSVETESTPVPLAGRGEFPKLGASLLDDDGVN